MTAALIAKLESASEGSRELDCELMALTYVWEQRHIGTRCWDDKDDTCCPGSKHMDWVWVDPRTDKWKTTARDGFEFSTSIDAALALAERVALRPYMADATLKGRWHWTLENPALLGDLEAEPWISGVARTPALAICAALLRASAAEGAG